MLLVAALQAQPRQFLRDLAGAVPIAKANPSQGEGARQAYLSFLPAAVVAAQKKHGLSSNSKKLPSLPLLNKQTR
jgi:hypothetical protein